MSDQKIVKPVPVSGFPEWLPEEKLVEERILGVIRQQFQRFGFAPIETPAIERREVLAAKGVVEKEIYALARLAAGPGEDASTEMALHFDLTVPLARYVAQHFNRLIFPFRRYQIQKVWRGERPQAGRFREFYQCDIDVVGNGRLSLLNDAEMPLVIHSIFSRIGIGRFVIRLNNRKILQGFLAHLGVTAERSPVALRIVDALHKVGADRVVTDLGSRVDLGRDRAVRLVDFISADPDIAALEAMAVDPLFEQGVGELAAVTRSLRDMGLPADAWRADLAIARGLDYYTGTVYETTLVDNPEIGSVCSGGRYDNLAATFTNRQLPGVGISIGLTRLLSRLFDAGLLETGAATPARVLVTALDPRFLGDYLAMAADLRRAGVDTEVYTEAKRIGDQLGYADRKGFALAVIAGDGEIDTGTVVVKALATGAQATHRRSELVAAVEAALAAAD
ncbi:MAG: histidine--tRNA ligase [Alphaproteobacteria bacterium]